MINWLLAFSPIFVVLVLMLGFRWGGSKAGPVGCLVAMLVAVVRFGAGWDLLLYAQLKGVLLTSFVLYITWMALLFYHTVDEAGAVKVSAGEQDLPEKHRPASRRVLLLIEKTVLKGRGVNVAPVEGQLA